MEDLRNQVLEALAGLTEEQILMVVAYAQCVRDGETPIPIQGLESLLEETA